MSVYVFGYKIVTPLTAAVWPPKHYEIIRHLETERHFEMKFDQMRPDKYSSVLTSQEF